MDTKTNYIDISDLEKELQIEFKESALEKEAYQYLLENLKTKAKLTPINNLEVKRKKSKGTSELLCFEDFCYELDNQSQKISKAELKSYFSSVPNIEGVIKLLIEENLIEKWDSSHYMVLGEIKKEFVSNERLFLLTQNENFISLLKNKCFAPRSHMNKIYFLNNCLEEECDRNCGRRHRKDKKGEHNYENLAKINLSIQEKIFKRTNVGLHHCYIKKISEHGNISEFQDYLKEMKELNNESSVYLLLGRTKSGKSTIINTLLGNKPVIKKCRNDLLITFQECKALLVGTSFESGTKFPKLIQGFLEKANNFICDGAGFGDNRKDMNELINGMCFSALFGSIENLYLIYVIDGNLFNSSQTPMNMKEDFQLLSRMLKHEQSAKKVLFLFNKTNEYNYQKFLARFDLIDNFNLETQEFFNMINIESNLLPVYLYDDPEKGLKNNIQEVKSRLSKMTPFKKDEVSAKLTGSECEELNKFFLETGLNKFQYYIKKILKWNVRLIEYSFLFISEISNNYSPESEESITFEDEKGFLTSKEIFLLALEFFENSIEKVIFKCLDDMKNETSYNKCFSIMKNLEEQLTIQTDQISKKINELIPHNENCEEELKDSEDISKDEINEDKIDKINDKFLNMFRNLETIPFYLTELKTLCNCLETAQHLINKEVLRKKEINFEEIINQTRESIIKEITDLMDIAMALTYNFISKSFYTVTKRILNDKQSNNEIYKDRLGKFKLISIENDTCELETHIGDIIKRSLNLIPAVKRLSENLRLHDKYGLLLSKIERFHKSNSGILQDKLEINEEIYKKRWKEFKEERLALNKYHEIQLMIPIHSGIYSLFRLKKDWKKLSSVNKTLRLIWSGWGLMGGSIPFKIPKIKFFMGMGKKRLILAVHKVLYENKIGYDDNSKNELDSLRMGKLAENLKIDKFSVKLDKKYKVVLYYTGVENFSERLLFIAIIKSVLCLIDKTYRLEDVFDYFAGGSIGSIIIYLLNYVTQKAIQDKMDVNEIVKVRKLGFDIYSQIYSFFHSMRKSPSLNLGKLKNKLQKFRGNANDLKFNKNLKIPTLLIKNNEKGSILKKSYNPAQDDELYSDALIESLDENPLSVASVTSYEIFLEAKNHFDTDNLILITIGKKKAEADPVHECLKQGENYFHFAYDDVPPLVGKDEKSLLKYIEDLSAFYSKNKLIINLGKKLIEIGKFQRELPE